jgi:hypothetical protein
MCNGLTYGTLLMRMKIWELKFYGRRVWYPGFILVCIPFFRVGYGRSLFIVSPPPPYSFSFALNRNILAL